MHGHASGLHALMHADVRATPSGRLGQPRQVLPMSGGPMVVRHYNSMYFAIVFTDADRVRAIEMAEQDAIPVFRGGR